MNAPTPPPIDPAETHYVAPPSGDAAPSKPKNYSGCLIGCLVVFLGCILLCGGFGLVAYRNAKPWAADVARNVARAAIADAPLAPEERQAILTQVDRVAEAYENGEITHEQLGEIAEAFGESKLWGLALVQGIVTQYIEPSGLSEEEKSLGKRNVMRVLRGAVEGNISDEELSALSEYFLQPVAGDPDNKQLKEKLTDEEVRSLLADVEKLAEDHEIPDEDYEFHVADTIEGIVDDVLSGETAAN